MSDVTATLSRLVALIEEAKGLADGVGPAAGTLPGLLDAALVAARDVAARGGEPDEGIRPEDLTTDNDK